MHITAVCLLLDTIENNKRYSKSSVSVTGLMAVSPIENNRRYSKIRKIIEI